MPGASPLQWVLLAELLPPEYKVLSGLSTSLATLAIFTILKVFPILQAALGQAGTYWLLGSIALSSNGFFYFFVPETKGKTFVEIQQCFRRNELF